MREIGGICWRIRSWMDICIEAFTYRDRNKSAASRAHLFRGRKEDEAGRSEADNRRVAGKSSLKGSKLSTLMPCAALLSYTSDAPIWTRNLPTGRILLWSPREDWGQVRARVSPTLVTVEAFFENLQLNLVEWTVLQSTIKERWWPRPLRTFLLFRGGILQSRHGARSYRGWLDIQPQRVNIGSTFRV